MMQILVICTRFYLHAQATSLTYDRGPFERI